MEKLNLRLNSIDERLFAPSTENDETIGSGANKISRNKIIASGRACLADYIGSALAERSTGYQSKIKSIGGSYKALSKAHSEQKLLFCAARAYAAIGKSAPENIEQVRNDQSLYKSEIFRATLAAIDMEVIDPMLYDVFTDLGGSMLSMESKPLGRTREIVVRSNEVFMWEDSSWGSGHSTTKNYLYADTITMNHRPFTSNGTIKWFQMIAADEGMDAGWYYTALMRGLWSKITALYTGALTDTAALARYVPSYLKFTSYSSANWAKAVEACAVASGVDISDLMAFGQLTALKAVVPNGTTSDTALTFGLGSEWMKNGFLSMVDTVPLFRVSPALVPGTANTSGQMFGLKDNIFITSRAGESYAPVYVLFAEGTPITIEYTPSTTANYVIDINMTAMMDVKAIFGGRTAVIQNVTI